MGYTEIYRKIGCLLLLFMCVACILDSSIPTTQQGVWTQHMHCENLAFYLWNDTDTQGMEIRILSKNASEFQEGQRYTFDIAGKEAYVLLEQGQHISHNFCVHHMETIPVSTVYEAHKGQVVVWREGKQFSGKVVFAQLQQEHGTDVMSIENVDIVSSILVSKH